MTQGGASAEASCEEGVLRAESCEGSWQREGGTSPLMGLGLAARLGIKPATVRATMQRVYRKAHVANRSEF